MNERPRFLLWAIAAMALVVAGPAVAAKETLVFSAAPGEGPENPAFYQPLVEVIAKASGKKVVAATPASYIEYAREMKAGTYDLVFDAAHFVGWRITRMGHVALVRLPGEMRIVVATHQDGPKSLDELAGGRKVCSTSFPSLSNLVLQQQFENPARQPVLVSVRTAKELAECMTAKRADAAAFSADLLASVEGSSNFRTLALDSAVYPERALTVTDQVDAETRAKISAALLSEEGAKALAPLLKHFKAEKLIPAESKSYESAAAVLRQAPGFQ